MPTNTLDAARQYVARGWHVLPLRPHDKRPLGEWRALREQQPTDEQLQEWFDGTNNNIGIIAGASGMVILDLDVGKREQVSRYLDDPEFSTGLIQKSPHGYHLFYQVNGGTYGDAVNALEEGTDIRYSGYVVAHPSVVRYEDTGEIGSYEWVSQDKPTPAPHRLSQTYQNIDGLHVEQAKPNKPDALDVLDRVLTSGFTPGAHADELRDVARLLLQSQMDDSDYLKRETTRKLLQFIDKLDPSPQGEVAVDATLKSVERHVKELVGRKQKPTAGGSGITISPTDEVLPMTSLLDLEQTYADWEVTYLVDEWLPSSSMVIMAGQEQSYKSWIGYDMAMSLANGDRGVQFLGHFNVANERHPVIIIQQEDFPGQLVQRLRTIRHTRLKHVQWNSYYDARTGIAVLDFPGSAPIYVHTEGHFNFSNPDAIPLLEERIKAAGAKFVYIDPWVSVASRTDDYFASDALKLYPMKQWRAKYGVSMVITTHTTKAGEGGKRTSISGSRFLSSGFDGAFMISAGETADTIKVHRSHKMTPPTSPVQLSFLINTERGDDEAFDVEVSEPDPQDVKLDSIVQAMQDGATTHTNIHKATGIPKATVSNYLTKLVESGTIVKTDKGYSLKGF